MPSFLRYLVSFDDYGEPVGVSYKGEGSFKTGIGAFFSLAMQVFLLLFAGKGFLGLVDFKDPQITQYQIYDSRSDGAEINFGETKVNALKFGNKKSLRKFGGFFYIMILNGLISFSFAASSFLFVLRACLFCLEPVLLSIIVVLLAFVFL